MADPLIATVGSAVPARTDYDAPIRYIEHVTQAAQQLGRELAKAGYRMHVFLLAAICNTTQFTPWDADSR